MYLKKKMQKRNTYNSRYSLVVTDPTTNQPLSGLTMGERTGSRIFHWVWSYVLTFPTNSHYIQCPNRLSPASGGVLYILVGNARGLMVRRSSHFGFCFDDTFIQQEDH